MTLRASLLVAAACGSLWAGTGAAAAQELQAGQMMTQSEADRLEALQADLDRKEAEDADRDRRDRRRQRPADDDDDRGEDDAALDDLQKAMDDLRADIAAENAAEMAEWEKVEAERLAQCHVAMPAEQLMMMDAVRSQYAMSINALRARGGPNAAEAIAGLERARDAAVAGLVDGQCQSGGEARFERERQAQIDRMRESQMPAFVRRADGSIGPAPK